MKKNPEKSKMKRFRAVWKLLSHRLGVCASVLAGADRVHDSGNVYYCCCRSVSVPYRDISVDVLGSKLDKQTFPNICSDLINLKMFENMVHTRLWLGNRQRVAGHNKSTCKGGEVGKNPKGKRPRTQVNAADFSFSYPSQPSKAKTVKKTAGESSKAAASKRKVSQTVTHPKHGSVSQTVTQSIQTQGKAKKTKKN
ncbi:hypothetical protein C5167_033247 [Papaver somniferum]|uniref:Uncharacterized protein n=1 Tax=Papaver somniferum TaxID=3469 RepID=A0A4Y7KAR9_PAPSO|nr:hypothetical protein C5167_033247 [Papaver somniferum]